ncbi:MAG TPA: glycosyltransferase family 2 protein [Thermoleophilaceae bacterium]
MSRPRLHLFARVPIVGAADTPPAPLVVCIDPSGDGDAEATRGSLAAQTAGPAAVIESPLERALNDTRADWVVRVAAGDLLAPHALERLGQAVTLAPGAAIVTCDDDALDRRGRRHSPRLRPGPSPDLWLAGDPAPALVAVRRERAAAEMTATATPYRLLLLLGGPDGAGQAHVPLVLCHRGTPAKAADSGAAAEALARWSPGATVERAEGGAARVRRPLATEPHVEAIVLYRDRPELLERCARSLLERSTYERLTLRAVDNASTEPETAELVARLAGDPRVIAERDARPFNFSRLAGAAASRSRADVLVFLNNDTEVISPDWLETLLEEALRPEVGAVAPLLVYPDGRVQHAGAAIGLHGWAGHPFAGLAPEAETPFGSPLDGTRNWLAVSAACLMVERRKFEQVGGFDEAFAVGGGDVDLCLRLTAAGWRSLCVPHVRLVHDESASRDPLAIPAPDFEASRRSYGDFRTVGDPFYHPALTLQDTTCRVRTATEEVGAA